MYRIVLLEEFTTDVYCEGCNEIVKQDIQKVDEEDDGALIAYYFTCYKCCFNFNYTQEEFERLQQTNTNKS